MPPEAMTARSSKLLSMTGSMTGCPHFLHSSVANGAKSPEMKVLALQRPHVTIFNGLPAPVASLLTNLFYHQSSARQVSFGKGREFTARNAAAKEELAAKENRGPGAV